MGGRQRNQIGCNVHSTTGTSQCESPWSRSVEIECSQLYPGAAERLCPKDPEEHLKVENIEKRS